ncbi:MAG: ATP-binding protein [Patescibacteria group bacterium]|nr:ATP-binding protein [Patescibacteria group bacterium]
MKTLKANPGAKRLMGSLRNMGYDCSTAIADLVDNSIAANSSEIHIEILPKKDSQPAAIVVADNGKGMDREELHEAMRFGAFQEYTSDDLGKYGLGLKTASLSQCRTLTISSKPKTARKTRSIRHCMRWDIDHVYETDDWDLLVPSDNELEKWEKDILNDGVSHENGTVVLWTNLDEALPLLSINDAREREKFLAQLILEVSAHLRMVFHRFIQGNVTGRHKLDIFVCGERLLPWDPFCRSEKTKELDIIKLPVVSVDPDGSKLRGNVTVSPFVLPREDEFSSSVIWRDASGPKGWNQQQGLYFYRNNRLLQAGGWSYLRSVDEHTKLLRVAIDFSSELDGAFSINITKMRARIPAEIREHLGNRVSAWAKTARIRYDGKVAHKINASEKREVILESKNDKQSSVIISNVAVGPLIFSPNSIPNKGLGIVENRKTGQIEIMVPQNHDLSSIFTLKGSKEEELKKLCLAALTMLEAVYNKKIKVNRIPITTLKKIYRHIL